MKLISIAVNPVPDEPICGTVVTPDGITLRFARWAPLTERKGTVVLLQGRAEFIEKYFETVQDLLSRGFAVVAFDWRGQGLSDRNKGRRLNFPAYAIDLKAIMEQVVLPDCPPPIFALAHSIGGTVIIRACHDGSNWFERIVMTAPLIGLAGGSYNRMARPILRVMRLLGRGSAFVPSQKWATVTEKSFSNPLTSDPVRYVRNMAVLESEPALGIGAPTIAWADAALRSVKDFTRPAYCAKIRQPILIIASGNDEVVSTKAIEIVAAKLPTSHHLIVAGAKHEILQEQDRYRNQFWAAFDAFVPGTMR